VVAGLGIHPEQLSRMLKDLRRSGVRDITVPGQPAPLALTHKRELRNVLVSEPVGAADGAHCFELLVDDEQDRLSDHVTGQHVGGMLLIEAARQASIVAIERQCRREDGLPPWGLVLQNFQARFDNYVFPLPTRIRVRIDESVLSDTQRELAIEVEFEQAGKAVCGVDFSVRLYPSDLLSKLETRRADQAIAAVLNAAREEGALADAGVGA